MNISKDSRLYAYLAAVCYIVSAIYQIVVSVIQPIQDDVRLSFIYDIVPIIICIVFVVALLLCNAKVLLAAMALNILCDLYDLIHYFCATNIIYLIASVLLLVILLSALMDKYNNLQRFWYLPAILYALSFIIVIILDCQYYMNEYPSLYSTAGEVFKYGGIKFVRILMWGIIPAAAYALVGLWLKVADHSPTSKPVKAAPATSPSCPSQAETIERLKEYKALLDCGAITEEEFQEKKRNLLGM